VICQFLRVTLRFAQWLSAIHEGLFRRIIRLLNLRSFGLIFISDVSPLGSAIFYGALVSSGPTFQYF
jgi:hypothetical protein